MVADQKIGLIEEKDDFRNIIQLLDLKMQKNQVIIIEDKETTINNPLIVEAAVSMGDPCAAPPQYLQSNNPYNQYNQYPQYQGQPPNTYYQGVPVGGPYAYQHPPPPPPALIVQEPLPVQIINHPQIIFIQQQLMMVCPNCGYGGSVARQSAGCAVYAWCVCLFMCTGFFCFWVPFCIDSCYDIEIVCTRCGLIKSRIQATFP